MSLEERITKLLPRLRYIALSMTNGDEYRADDLVQNAMVRILKTCDEATEDHIVFLRAKSAMLDTVHSEKTYNRVVQTENTLGAPAGVDEDPDQSVWESYLPRDQRAQTPEDEIIEREELAAIFQAIGQLPQDNQKIIKALAYGKSQSEIASELGISRAAISQRMDRIAAKLNLTLVKMTLVYMRVDETGITTAICENRWNPA